MPTPEYNPPPDGDQPWADMTAAMTAHVINRDEMIQELHRVADLIPDVVVAPEPDMVVVGHGVYRTIPAMVGWVEAYRDNPARRSSVLHALRDRLDGYPATDHADWGGLPLPRRSPREWRNGYCDHCDGYFETFRAERVGDPGVVRHVCLRCLVDAFDCPGCDRITSVNTAHAQSPVMVAHSGNHQGEILCTACTRDAVQCPLCDLFYHYHMTECPGVHTPDMTSSHACAGCATRGRGYRALTSVNHVDIYGCPSCMSSSRLVTCGMCEGWTPRSGTYWLQLCDADSVADWRDEEHHISQYVCFRCVDRELSECDHCGTYFSRQSVFARHDCRDDCECDNCDPFLSDGGSSGGIYSYSYKPQPEFKGDGPLYLGFELEIECDRGRSMERLVNATYDAFDRDVVYLKEDGSIGNGFEIVSHPLSWDWMRVNFNWAGVDTIAGLGAYAASSCGLHVHASRAGFSGRAHEYRWLKFMYDNRTKVNKFAGRESDQWASWYSSNAAKGEKMRIVKKEVSHGNRYQAININNLNTYEVRVFASTVNARELQARISFVAATIEYTRSLRSSDVCKDKGLKWRPFVGWVAKHKVRFAALHSVLSDLFVI